MHLAMGERGLFDLARPDAFAQEFSGRAVRILAGLGRAVDLVDGQAAGAARGAGIGEFDQLAHGVEQEDGDDRREASGGVRLGGWEEKWDRATRSF